MLPTLASPARTSRASLVASMALCGAILLPGCRDSGTSEASGEVKSTAEEVVEAVKEAVTRPSLSPEERAERFGFAAHLPKDTASLMMIQNGNELARQFSETALWRLFCEMVAEEEGVEVEQELAGQNGKMISGLLGHEIFIATGPGMELQMDNLIELNEITNYYQMRAIARAFAKAVAGGELDSLEDELGGSPGMEELLGDFGEHMDLIEKVQVPPVLFGLKAPDAAVRGQVEQLLAQYFPMIASMGEEVEFEKGGASFKGAIFRGESLSAMLEGEREDMEADLGEDATERLLETLKTKDIVLATGAMDDYLLVYLGDSVDSCPVVAGLSDSLLADDAISFVDSYGEVPVVGLLYSSEAMVEGSGVTGITAMAKGIRDGLDEVPAFGDMREIGGLLDLVGERDQELMAMMDSDRLGGIIALDDGLRFELFGGLDNGGLDRESPRRLDGLGEGEGVLLFANWTNDPEHQKVVRATMETLVETAYAITTRVTELGGEELEEFGEYFKMFDQLLRQDLVGVWDGLRQVDEGLGTEVAMVVDLEGAVPSLPNVPTPLVEEGSLPRYSIVSPVVDRAKLADGWKAMDGSLRAIAKSLSQAGLGAINLPVPTYSESSGLTTWYYDSIALSDDLKPSVTVNDEWFVMSSSRNQALDLVSKAGSGEGDPGAWARLDLDVLRQYGTKILGILDEHGEDLMGSGGDLAEFRAELPRILKLIEASEELEQVTLHAREEAGERRVSLHFDAR